LPPAAASEEKEKLGTPQTPAGGFAPCTLEIDMLNVRRVNVYLAAQVGCSCAVSKRDERIFLLPGGWTWNVAHLVGRNCPGQHNFVVTADV